MSIFGCKKCHEILGELNSLRATDEELKAQMSELLDRIGLRRKKLNEVWTEGIFTKDPLYKYFKVRES